MKKFLCINERVAIQSKENLANSSVAKGINSQTVRYKDTPSKVLAALVFLVVGCLMGYSQSELKTYKGKYPDIIKGRYGTVEYSYRDTPKEGGYLKGPLNIYGGSGKTSILKVTSKITNKTVNGKHFG